MSDEFAPPLFLESERLTYTPLVRADASEWYLGWLNDPEVLRYRAPKAFPTTVDALLAYIESIPSRGDLVLAARTKDGRRHVGNVSLNSIQWVHGTAELSIMLGDRSVWGQGFGREVIGAVTDHAFSAMGLRRVWAESPNPAFNRAVAALGWRREGTKREAFLVDGDHVDIECWGILAAEWRAAGGAP